MMLRLKTKAQSAMEYLMTYGWAILVIAIIVSLLFALGLFNSGANTPNFCVSQSNFNCWNPAYTSNGITLTISQNTGEDIIDSWAFVVSSSERIGPSGLPENFSTSSTANMLHLGAMTVSQTITFNYSNTTAGDIPTGNNIPVGLQFTGYVWLAYCSVPSCNTPTSFAKVGTINVKNSGPSTFSQPVTTSTSTTSTSTTTSSTTSTSTSTSTSSSTTTSSTTSTMPQCFNLASGVCNGDLFYTQSTTLTGNVSAANSLTIQSGVTITTDGVSYMLANTIFTNGGTIITGNPSNGGVDCCTNPANYQYSYGGSGGGGTGLGGAANGGATLAPGGTSAGCCGGTGGNGGTPSASGITDSFIANTMVPGGLMNYLIGAGGGWGYACCGGGSGGNGAYGIYIQGNTVINSGTIEAAGTDGGGNSGAGEAGGGGGGGAVLIAYGSGAAPGGSYSIGGGSGGSSCCGWTGGLGGNGQVIKYEYANPPIAPPSP